ncbi:NAD(P)-dependent dehydrogenase (short-subunit alcohol dehydrogenase family) [Microbacterium sp. SLBN-154]|uniref:SDR family NAD(P)-dependent oxidoreductase n=1 Tax=Microbacterium sp. SLBN-154 TaxID=2768458 RepID=UPI0011540A64|nr:SDR family oxidoreductase [Microbacterium sp. SLBN-154]TQK17721.1 NAD(P)-dependent dehydrogenase (short-subunit alcohol dehydrogenase family) [Microbacterium sp. SLBN-154]
MTVLDLFSLADRTALVTGAASGIGFAIAQALGEAGARVMITGRQEPRLVEAVDALHRAGVDAGYAVGDVTDPDQARLTVDAAQDAYGEIDILVNNVGRGSNLRSETMTEREWDDLIEKNLTSVFRMSRLVAPGMLERRRGSIINLGSISGFIVNRPQWHSPYGAAKAGVHHLTKSLAAEWADRGVRVNAIAPGFVAENGIAPEEPLFRRYWADEVPMARVASPREIAPAALYFASDASTFATGSVLLVDGGYTLW